MSSGTKPYTAASYAVPCITILFRATASNFAPTFSATRRLDMFVGIHAISSLVRPKESKAYCETRRTGRRSNPLFGAGCTDPVTHAPEAVRLDNVIDGDAAEKCVVLRTEYPEWELGSLLPRLSCERDEAFGFFAGVPCVAPWEPEAYLLYGLHDCCMHGIAVFWPVRT